MAAEHLSELELALAGAEHLDATYVTAYDERAGFDPSADLDALRARGLGAESTVIDFGAGTGTFAVAAASICKRVVAVDISPAMVDAIRSKSVSAGVNVECVRAGFLSYTHEGDLPDFIYTRNALHHLPDFWKGIALRRIAALLALGGTFQLRDLVFSFDLRDAETGIASWLESAADSRDAGWTREELVTHLRDEYSTYTWLLEPMIARAGFEIAIADYGNVEAYASYICVKPAS
jgi:SAM-dependent methyltransferase